MVWPGIFGVPMTELKADVLVIGRGHRRRQRRAASAENGAATSPDRQGRARRRGNQLWQRGMNRTRLGVSLHVLCDLKRVSCAMPSNSCSQVRYRLVDLPAFLPWLFRYFPRLRAGSGATRGDGCVAADPAQPDRARTADGGGGSGAVATARMDQAVSFGELAGQGHARVRAGAAVWRRRRPSRFRRRSRSANPT